MDIAVYVRNDPVNRVDPDGRDSISFDFYSNALFNFGFVKAVGLATEEDFNNWLFQTLTPVSSNDWFDPYSQTMNLSVIVSAPFWPEPVFDAATGLLIDPTGYEELGIQDASFGFWTTVVPVARGVVGIGAAVGRGVVGGISSSEVRSIGSRLIADETGAIRIQSGGHTISKAIADALNTTFGKDFAPRDWGRLLEKLKEANSLSNRFHGTIVGSGDYLDSAGNVIDNIGSYIP